MWVFRQKSAELLCFTPFPSMGKATDTFERAHTLRQGQRQYHTRPVAVVVPDDMRLGKFGPILWPSFLHLYHFYGEERYGFGTLVMSCLGMVAYISVYVLFVQYWRHSWDVLWDWCSFSKLSIYIIWLEEVHMSSCFRVPSFIPEESCWTWWRTS